MSASSVYIGLWINWSHGAVAGSTITLSNRAGGFLTAFLAILVSFAGAACWRITSYAVHQCRASRDYKDTLHHQQQVILCNTGSPAGALWTFVQLPWYWRRNAVRSFLRVLPLALLALLNSAAFGIAGIFSSEVIKAAGNETLIRSPNCGLLTLTAGAAETVQNAAAFASMELNDTLAATTYSWACYDNTQNILGCSQFVQQQLHWTSKTNATCPFSPDLCIYGGTAAYEMDTGLLDTHTHLGINAAKPDRVQYRKVTSCSPIHSKGHVETFNQTSPNLIATGDLFYRYLYGPIVNESDYTYQYDTHASTDIQEYTLTSLLYIAGSTPNAWLPIPALNRSDADVSLFLLAPNSVVYQAPVADPFFDASTPYYLSVSYGRANFTYYQANQWVNALACADQHQFCNPNNGKCTLLSGADPVFSLLPEIDLNAAQTSTAINMELTVSSLSTYHSVNSRGTNALRASESLYQGVQVPLPDHQWMTEVSTWFAVSMAKLQQRTIQYATGPSYIPDGLSLMRPMNKYQERLCNNTIIRSQAGTTSFSVLGVGIILIVSSVLIVTSLMISIVVGSIRQKLYRKEYKSLQWILDDKLQLQRMAYEEAGQGVWSGGTDAVPVTLRGNKLGLPVGIDWEHPRLCRASEQSESRLSVTPEAEGLMPKQMGHSVSVVTA